MAKVTLNDHLDDMMERLMDEKLTEEELERELKRSRALALIADKKIQHSKNVITAARYVSRGDIDLSYIRNEYPELKSKNDE